MRVALSTLTPDWDALSSPASPLLPRAAASLQLQRRLSLEANAIALRYLSDQQLTRLSLSSTHKPGPQLQNPPLPPARRHHPVSEQHVSGHAGKRRRRGRKSAPAAESAHPRTQAQDAASDGTNAGRVDEEDKENELKMTKKKRQTVETQGPAPDPVQSCSSPAPDPVQSCSSLLNWILKKNTGNNLALSMRVCLSLLLLSLVPLLSLSLPDICSSKPKDLPLEPRCVYRTPDQDVPPTADTVPPQSPDPVPENTNPRVWELSRANGAFALSLYKQLSSGRSASDNIFMSPISVSTAFAMTKLGACNQTLQQIMKVFEFDTIKEKTSDQVHYFFAKLNCRLFRKKDDTTELISANRLFGEKSLNFNQTYQNISQTVYGATLMPLNFKEDPEGSRVIINDWISNQTEKRIQHTLPPGALDSTTVWSWSTPSTSRASGSTSSTKRKCLWRTSTCLRPGPACSDDVPGNQVQVQEPARGEVQVLEMAYRGDITMVIILPHSGTPLSQVEEGLDLKKLTSWMDSLTERKVSVRLPKFKVEDQFSLKEKLETMGLRDLFSAERASLPGERERGEREREERERESLPGERRREKEREKRESAGEEREEEGESPGERERGERGGEGGRERESARRERERERERESAGGERERKKGERRERGRGGERESLPGERERGRERGRERVCPVRERKEREGGEREKERRGRERERGEREERASLPGERERERSEGGEKEEEREGRESAGVRERGRRKERGEERESAGERRKGERRRERRKGGERGVGRERRQGGQKKRGRERERERKGESKSARRRKGRKEGRERGKERKPVCQGGERGSEREEEVKRASLPGEREKKRRERRGEGQSTRMLEDGSDTLFISEAYHKAFLEVNEEGSEAAAATAVVAIGRALRPDEEIFLADRPFLVVIREPGVNALLFTGRVADPCQQE
ncbi:hypothetical protein WMY93_024296 [Mugilogobius chulae]|uniref:Serpin domain-containing protein n=1 Tax=Mugilogobius chulae TaxID=88201 RepID=A0AAW0N608_9GOBI